MQNTGLFTSQIYCKHWWSFPYLTGRNHCGINKRATSHKIKLVKAICALLSSNVCAFRPPGASTAVKHHSGAFSTGYLSHSQQCLTSGSTPSKSRLLKLLIVSIQRHRFWRVNEFLMTASQIELSFTIKRTLFAVKFPVNISYFVLPSLAKHRVITARPLRFSPTVPAASDGVGSYWPKVNVYIICIISPRIFRA